MPKQLFFGVQAIHTNNRTHTTQEGYAHIDDINSMPSITYSSGVKEYYRLSPGLYKVCINGTTYCFMIHDEMSGSDRFVIEALDHTYCIINGKKTYTPIYKLHDQFIEEHGYPLNHSVNAHLDLLVVNGKTKWDRSSVGSFKYPCKMNFSSIYNIRVTKSDGSYEEYLFNTKQYLKSVDFYDKEVCDTLYLDAATKKALFAIKTKRVVLSGFERFTEYSSYSTNDIIVIRYEDAFAKHNGRVKCTHLPTIPWSKIIDTSYTNEGVCCGPSNYSGIWFKINRKDCPDLEAFRDALKYWNNVTETQLKADRQEQYRHEVAAARALGLPASLITLHESVVTPFIIVFESAVTEYKTLLLDSYEIPTYYDKCWLQVIPYTPEDIGIEWLDNIIGIIPNNGIIPSMASQMNETTAHIRANNRIITNLIADDESIDHISIIHLENIIAVVPNNGIINTISVQESDSPITIINNNHMYDNLLVAGDLNTRTSYFYHHLVA